VPEYGVLMFEKKVRKKAVPIWHLTI